MIKVRRYTLSGMTQRKGIAATSCVKKVVTESSRIEPQAARAIQIASCGQRGGLTGRDVNGANESAEPIAVERTVQQVEDGIDDAPRNVRPNRPDKRRPCSVFTAPAQHAGGEREAQDYDQACDDFGKTIAWLETDQRRQDWHSLPT